jgi:hypothetical protein
MKLKDSNKPFNEYLVERYPTLFPKDEKDNPIQPSCGIWCPVGWENLVEDLCKALSSYCCMQQVYTEKYKPIRIVKEWFYKKIFTKVFNPIYNKFNPYKNLSFTVSHGISLEVRAKFEQDHKRELAILRFLDKIRKIFYPYYKWDISPVPPVTIDQIKEKFGQLRVYYDGGDKKVAGMVSFAEYLSASICQNTGNRGSLCKRGSWYSTLSPEEAEKNNFTQA